MMMWFLNGMSLITSFLVLVAIIALQTGTFFSINLFAAWPLFLNVFLGLCALSVSGFLVTFIVEKRVRPGDEVHFAGWKGRVFALLIAYNFMNIFIYKNVIEGNVDGSDGQYFITNHGHVMRKISASEYAWLSCWDLRNISCFYLLGIWFLFTYFCSINSLPRKVGHGEDAPP